MGGGVPLGPFGSGGRPEINFFRPLFLSYFFDLHLIPTPLGWVLAGAPGSLKEAWLKGNVRPDPRGDSMDFFGV